MISMDLKIETRREALAGALVRMAQSTAARIQANDLPKKDVLATARAAGMLAAKRTPDLIPDCHPLNITHVGLEQLWVPEGLQIRARVSCLAPTGVEMEALTAASVAALTVYDMAKCVDKGMEITGLSLIEKTGGKSDYPVRLKSGFRAAVVVTSDRSFKGASEDRTGPFLKAALEGFGAENVAYHLLPDERDQITALLLALCEDGYDLVLTTGGTGLSPRDVTVEAARGVIERELPGVMEAARSFGQRRTPYAMLSRGVAGQRGGTLIVTFPGSFNGCRESMAALYPYLLHAHPIMGGGGH